MIEQLFGSKTRVKLLHLFYTNPNRAFYVREITRKIDEQINSVRRELSNLLNIGLIKSDSSGNKLYYEVNQKYKHYQALRAMFTGMSGTQEAVVPQNDLGQRFKELGAVQLAVITGVLVRNKTAPVDVLIVGDVNRTKTEKLMAELEEEEGTELRYTILNPDDFEYRMSLNDHFLTTVLSGKHSVVAGALPGEKVAEAAPETAEPAADKTKTPGLSKKPKAKKKAS